jgi:hypothetical protein
MDRVEVEHLTKAIALSSRSRPMWFLSGASMSAGFIFASGWPAFVFLVGSVALALLANSYSSEVADRIRAVTDRRTC